MAVKMPTSNWLLNGNRLKRREFPTKGRTQNCQGVNNDREKELFASWQAVICKQRQVSAQNCEHPIRKTLPG
jgi:hypothetical protein